MTCPHFSISIRFRCNKRSGTRGSAVAGTAYQSAEKLFSEYDGRTKNYSYKQPELVFSDNILTSLWDVMGYTVLLCFTLFKTGSLAKSVLHAH